jgi:hypothetical protein
MRIKRFGFVRPEAGHDSYRFLVYQASYPEQLT